MYTLRIEKKETIMAIYLTQFTYTAEAWAALTKNPEDRSIAIGQLAQKLGGRLLSLHYCFGEFDGVALFDVPDDMAAETVRLATLSAGHLKEIKITKLFTVQETMEAMRKARSVTFSGPH
jgi:uncharacterized protein with GYD domain